MHTWFECKIRYEKTMENGMIQKVTESYLVDALSFTEAEARIIEEVTPFNFLSVMKKRRTAGLNAGSFLSPWTKRAAPRRKPSPLCWYRPPTCVTP